MAEWVPINLDVEAGSFVLPLVDFADAAEFAPLPASPAPASLDQGHLGAENSAVDAAFAVGLFGLLDLEGSGKWEQRCWEFSRWLDVRAQHAGRIDYHVRWGFGFRVHIQNSKVDTSASVNTPQQISFAAELGLTQVSYAVEMFGLSLPSALGWLPPPSYFGAQMVRDLDTNIRSAVSGAMTAAASPIHPVPMALRFDGDYARRAVDKAVSVVFAARHIRAGVEKARALEIAQGRAGVRTAEVGRVYDVWGAAGAATSSAFLLAKRTATEWLDEGETQPEMSRTVARRHPLQQAVSADSAGTLAEAEAALDRIVLRSQAVSATASAKLGYGPIGSGNVSGSASKLVYELLLRRQLSSTSVATGVSVAGGQFSGLRLAASLAKVDSKIQANVGAVAASTSLGISNARFDLYDWGIHPSIPAGILQGSSFSASDFCTVYASVEHAKTELAKHPELIQPTTTEFVTGVDYVENSFPGARLIYFALDQLRREKYLQTAERLATKLGFERSHMGAAYDYFWDDKQPSKDPPEDVRNEAGRLLELTRVEP